MWAWLNTNSAAVQATATVILIGVTAWYVRLTHDLSRTARNQLQILSDERVARHRELQSSLKLLRMILGFLPNDRRYAERIREAPEVDAGTLTQFQRLAAEFGTATGQNAAIAAGSFRWLNEQIQVVKAPDPKYGVDWERFPWDRWMEERQRAQDRVDEIWTAVHDPHSPRE